jgi:hypothetical protein
MTTIQLDIPTLITKSLNNLLFILFPNQIKIRYLMKFFILHCLAIHWHLKTFVLRVLMNYYTFDQWDEQLTN